MAPPGKPPPLPLAPDRAAISNRISLLIASHSSVLKTMNFSSSAAAARQRPAQPSSFQIDHDGNDDDSDLFRSRPNEGVGYIPDKAQQASKDAFSEEDRMLRGRILGKRGSAAAAAAAATANGSAAGRRRADDDGDDDDPGRSSLGKRKRPRRAVEGGQEAAAATAAPDDEGSGVPAAHDGGNGVDVVCNESKDLHMDDTIPTSELDLRLDTVPNSTAPEETSNQKEKRKRKNKKKKKKKKDKQPNETGNVG